MQGPRTANGIAIDDLAAIAGIGLDEGGGAGDLDGFGDIAHLEHNLYALARRTDVNPILLSTMQTTFANMKPGYEATQVFTDDHAPIEWIVDDMVVRFTLSGGLSGIQQ